MAVRANKPTFNIREKLKELTHSIGLKGRELMSAATTQDARDLVSAGRKNLIINGDMRIAQRSTSANVPNSGAIGTVDRWYSWVNYNSGAVVMSQETDAPAGFQNSLKVIRNDSSSAAQYFFLGQKIEAQNLSQLAVGTSSAKLFTISFWVKSNKPGTYNLEAIDDNGSHQLVKQYKINNSGVWEYKSITFPPNNVGGVPTYDNTVGLDLAWWLSSNANTTYTSGSLTDNWAAFATNRRNVGGNPILDTGEYWMISGVQLEVGKNATDFEHRPYGEELALCQRYYVEIGNVASPLAVSVTSRAPATKVMGIHLPVAMRAVPTVGTTGYVRISKGGSYQDSNSSLVIDGVTPSIYLGDSGVDLSIWWNSNFSVVANTANDVYGGFCAGGGFNAEL
jgi:hypothetical protein